VTTPTRYRVATSIAPVPPPNPGALSRDYFAGHVPVDEQYRPQWGRSLDMNRIDLAIRAANMGIMSRITDLSRETIALDGHVSALLQKRLLRIAALDYDIQPAVGTGIDKGRAKDYAAMVRENIAQLSNFPDRLIDLAWGIFDGRAAGEIEWYRYGKQWAVRDLHWIHPRRLSFGPDRDIRVIDPMRQIGNFTDAGFPVEMVPYKFLTFRPRMFGDYQEREGLGYRTLYWSFFGRVGKREQMELMEIFGKPWRILIPETGPGMPPINVNALQEGFAALTLLGFHNTARMPANVKVQVVQPEQGAGQVHQDVILDSRDVLSKLYLGNVLTTDARPTGLGANTASVQQSGEDLLTAGDARRISECVEDKLTDAICIVNFGPEAVTHAPKFIIRTDPPLDRNAESDRLGKAVGMGVPVALEEYRQRVGIREVRPDEPYIIRTQRTPELGQVAPAPAPEVVYPAGQAPMPGELVDAPMPAINVGDQDVNPGALPQLPGGTPAPQLPPGAPGLATDDPDLDGEDDVAALARKMTDLGIERCQHGKPNRCRVCGIERVRDVELGADGQPEWSIAWKPIGGRGVPVPPAAGGPDDELDEDADDDQVDDDEAGTPIIAP
jgi:phage gp29-like protein